MLSSIHDEFERRAGQISFLGLGLSVDVYCPDLFDLMAELSQQSLVVDYLEIFQASRGALRKVREAFPEVPLAYHAEGIWVTQPHWKTANGTQERMSVLTQDLGVLNALWVNQECATKEMAGRNFGTYLPPIFSEDSAKLIAGHSCEIQRVLENSHQRHRSSGCLFCLEGPPLSYFMVGDLSYAEFFRVITDNCPCGLVLDLGHVWTVYRYSGSWKTQSLMEFFEIFLKNFPLERVIQIHLAGLACHPNVHVTAKTNVVDSPPFWIDAHEASIPSDLMDMLIRTLEEPDLINLKGIALEVDNKAIPLICEELKLVKERLGSQKGSFWKGPGHREDRKHTLATREFNDEKSFITEGSVQTLVRSYENMVEYLSSAHPDPHAQLVNWGIVDGDRTEGLALYRDQYLPYEILSWGGDLRMMFPRGCQLLDQHQIPLEGFCDFWLSHHRPSEVFYDFFLVKIGMFEEFFRKVLPECVSAVEQEGAMLREGYAMACEREDSGTQVGVAIEEKRWPSH